MSVTSTPCFIPQLQRTDHPLGVCRASPCPRSLEWLTGTSSVLLQTLASSSSPKRCFNAVTHPHRPPRDRHTLRRCTVTSDHGNDRPISVRQLLHFAPVVLQSAQTRPPLRLHGIATPCRQLCISSWASAQHPGSRNAFFFWLFTVGVHGPVTRQTRPQMTIPPFQRMNLRMPSSTSWRHVTFEHILTLEL
ncbi:hypothetical protein EJ04DRAFT_128722 [Polyplosphaeria fusca]|uniref:Uncharacterized protein n=1 Tax=Polyplosphaeria fusca TaxID=682080 RepID=A0A9P4QI83_9PLEO|nr:hypothetical protein EJ04DRAFT_128722 [Polyplosphaeria fusca]